MINFRINHVSWTDLSTDDVSIAATVLMIGLEQNAFLLAESVANQKIIIKPTNNICKYFIVISFYHLSTCEVVNSKHCKKDKHFKRSLQILKKNVTCYIQKSEIVL